MRIRNFLEIQQPPEQAGFRKNYSTLDHLHTINQIIEKSQEHGMDISLAFIDYNKAFYTLDHDFILEALKNQGVPMKLIKLMKKMYVNPQSRIITDKIGLYFQI